MESFFVCGGQEWAVIWQSYYWTLRCYKSRQDGHISLNSFWGNLFWLLKVSVSKRKDFGIFQFLQNLWFFVLKWEESCNRNSAFESQTIITSNLNQSWFSDKLIFYGCGCTIMSAMHVHIWMRCLFQWLPKKEMIFLRYYLFRSTNKSSFCGHSNERQIFLWHLYLRI